MTDSLEQRHVRSGGKLVEARGRGDQNGLIRALMQMI